LTKPRKELSQEVRTLIAVFLSVAVIGGFSLFYKPTPPPPAPTPSTTQSQTLSQTPPPTTATVPPPAPPQPVGSKIKGVSATPATAVPVRAATAERTIVVEGKNLYRVELSNRGGIAQSWILSGYTDESKPPKPLDVIHPAVAKQLGAWPLSIVMDDPKLEAQANAALYEVSTTGQESSGILAAPAEVNFDWSDGHLSVTKKLKFDASYVASVEVSAQIDGHPLPAAVSWRGGFGDATADRSMLGTSVFYSLSGKLNSLPAGKLGQPSQTEARSIQSGPLDFAGIEDQYFGAAFLPPLETSGARAGSPDILGASMTLIDWSINRDVVGESTTSKELIPEIAVGSAKGAPLELRLFVGPKNLDELKAIRPPLNNLVQFGWFGFIAEPMFYVLRWIYSWLPNYGWAIVLLTFAINMALFPLKIRTNRSMQKMQKVGPEVRAIQDRYKKYSMRDPRKAKMNEEVMAVYNREGINPLGSCLPMLLQLPLWFALNSMIRATIELRHAPWFGWIKDLSTRDPYYVLPILMAVFMYVTTKLTPMPSTDASQQRMMKFMPIMMGGMFIIYPASAGLVLYILASYIVGTAQQLYLNRIMPPPVPVPARKKK
jgi:YidC/Oxa1 family membrane protein insertase